MPYATHRRNDANNTLVKKDHEESGTVRQICSQVNHAKRVRK